MRVEINKKSHYKDIMAEHNVSKATAFLAKKRGYLVKNYHVVKEDYTSESVERFGEIYEECKQYAFALLWKYYPQYSRFHEDWISDAILRALLKSNREKNAAYVAKVAISFARDYEKGKESKDVISLETI